MKVIKFGGSSVGSVEGILSVKKIVESQKEPVIVVVSALSGITDQLYATSKMASEGNENYLTSLEEMIDRHYKMVEEVIPEPNKPQTVEKLKENFNDLTNIFRGIYLIKDISIRITDTIVSYGEVLSSIIVSNLITNAVHFDARNFIKTINQFDKHIVDFPTTNKLVQEVFQNTPKICVSGGFISTDVSTGYTTSLGRGGSDYTASILASALNASKLEIWTDVD